jgi:cellulose synthase/poly-beta-1,6-N-acetylglucosamine synthase-like glycosyltransferase
MLALLAWGLVATQALTLLPFAVELVAGLAGRRPVSRAMPGAIPAAAVLMPAHDEGRQIARTLAALRPVLPPEMRLLVVADNCTDDTAAQARAAGADVAERHDPARRGKGYALAFGRERLAADPPAVVIVLDADCRVEPGALARLARAAEAQAAAVQGLYLLAPTPQAPAMVQVSGFAFMVKNLLRQRGLSRIGAPVPLGGTGMALPWSLFRDAPLGGDHLVEDLALSVALTRAGHPPRFVADAAIWSDPADAAATLTQRARWEGGFLRVAREHGPSLLAEGVRRARLGLLWMGLHVLTPPLTLLVALQAVLTALAIGLSMAAGRAGPVAGSIGLGLMLAGAVLAAWGLHGRPWLSGRALVRLPLYLLWKLPGYLRLARGRGPSGWVRTERGP